MNAQTDDLASVLAEIRSDLAEIKTLAGAVATHGLDIDAVKKDVAAIEVWVAKMDKLLADYPERLARLETKQESDDQARQADETKAVGKQAKVNLTFTERIAELFDVTSVLQKASLKLFGILLLIAVAIVSVILKAAGY